MGVQWDHPGVLHFELLNSNQTLNEDLYSQQLQYVHENLLRKHSTLVNRRNGVLLIITQDHILQESPWGKILDYRLVPYSPYLVPSDFHLFDSLQNYFSSVLTTEHGLVWVFCLISISIYISYLISKLSL